jgi:hypothetical protein
MAPLGFIIAILLARPVWGTAELTPSRPLSSPARDDAIFTPVSICDEALTGSESAICQLLRLPRYRTPFRNPFEANGLFVGTAALLAFLPYSFALLP